MTYTRGPWTLPFWRCSIGDEQTYYQLTYTEMLDWLDANRGSDCRVLCGRDW
jgi:hypothetical protein